MNFIYNPSIFSKSELCQNMPGWVIGHLRRMTIMGWIPSAFLRVMFALCLQFSKHFYVYDLA